MYLFAVDFGLSEGRPSLWWTSSEVAVADEVVSLSAVITSIMSRQGNNFACYRIVSEEAYHSDKRNIFIHKHYIIIAKGVCAVTKIKKEKKRRRERSRR